MNPTFITYLCHYRDDIWILVGCPLSFFFADQCLFYSVQCLFYRLASLLRIASFFPFVHFVQNFAELVASLIPLSVFHCSLELITIWILFRIDIKVFSKIWMMFKLEHSLTEQISPWQQHQMQQCGMRQPLNNNIMTQLLWLDLMNILIYIIHIGIFIIKVWKYY